MPLLLAVAFANPTDTGLAARDPEWVDRAADHLVEAFALADVDPEGDHVRLIAAARERALACTEADARVERLLEWAPDRVLATHQGPMTVAAVAEACRDRVRTFAATPARGCGARPAYAESTAASGGAWGHTRYEVDPLTRWTPLTCDRVESGSLPAGVSTRAALDACGPGTVAVRGFDWVYVRDEQGALEGRRARLYCLGEDLLTTAWDYDAPGVDLPPR